MTGQMCGWVSLGGMDKREGAMRKGVNNLRGHALESLIIKNGLAIGRVSSSQGLWKSGCSAQGFIYRTTDIFYVRDQSLTLAKGWNIATYTLYTEYTNMLAILTNCLPSIPEYTNTNQLLFSH